MDSMQNIISNNIKKILKEYNLNQYELAKIAGVSESTVGKWVLKKSMPRMGAIQKIADHFGLPKSYILEESKKELKMSFSEYTYLPIKVAAGIPEMVDPVTENDLETISIPDSIMGKWAGCEDIYIMRVNGESMNKTIPNHSLIAVKKTKVSKLENNDMVLFSDQNECSVKKIFKHGDNLIFRPHSTDERFTDYIVPIEEANQLMIHGKVVLYIVEMD